MLAAHLIDKIVANDANSTQGDAFEYSGSRIGKDSGCFRVYFLPEECEVFLSCVASPERVA